MLLARGAFGNERTLRFVDDAVARTQNIASIGSGFG